MNPDSRSKFFPRQSYRPEKFQRRGPSDRVLEGAAQSIPVHAECDVPVVGGGPPGTAAAAAAAREGADVILLERYNHLGGLSTGGLVIWIDRMTDWDGNLVIRGVGEKLLSRLTSDQITGSRTADLVAARGCVSGGCDPLANHRSEMVEGVRRTEKLTL